MIHRYCVKCFWFCIATLVLTACSTSPLGRKQFTLLPAGQIDAMGVQSFDKLKKETPIENNAVLNRRVRCVADAITRVSGGQWEVVVFRDDTPNAFALPGGKIGVHTGLMNVARNQHQLAAVIGHEIGHVQAQHGNERVSQQFAVDAGVQLIAAIAQPQSATGQTLMGLLGVGAQVGILLPFSRIQENESDMIGQDLMAKAGFDPRESITLWQNMAKASEGKSQPEFLSTHPAHSSRIDDLRTRLATTMPLYEQAKRAGKAPDCR